MAVPGRQYGLLLPKKTQPLHRVLQKPSVFGNDSDDDEETSVSESLQREAAKKQAMKQTKLEIQKALAEDSTVYEYDSIYDEMQKKKEENNPKLLLGKDRKPKYIHNLLKAVEIRKKEQEKRMEKKIQREREMENGEFDDKEAFVTSAYKKKLEERAEEEEREKRAAALEARLDVTKQKDLSGFYRHLLNQTVGEEALPKSSFREARTGIKEEKLRGYSDEANSEDRPQQNCTLQTGDEGNPDADSDFDRESSDDDEGGEHKVNRGREEDTGASRKYRKHHKSQSHSRSPSEERGHGTRHQSSRSPKSRRHEQRGGRHQDSTARDQEGCPTGHGHRKEKSSHRHRESDRNDHCWRRWEQEDKPRERQDRERKRERYSSRERARDRRDDHDQHGEREEGSRDKEGRRERQENNGRHREMGKRERSRDGRGSSPGSRPEHEFPDQERSNKLRNVGKDTGDQEKPSPSETSLATKHRLAEERQEKGSEQERPPEPLSKFAKRSNEETVMSARDRYLARQMARINAKTYIEKEDDD
ncbi:nuclear speckle splicing regulatory protein 1 isoform X2 [Onychomys torridus]|uniref:nuclear speckle splicing regulatory protein 1 isoform X2 n=1 Tax=Onychomys torridus TaxID=38674 RepID=UPI00167FD38C|nr:nuclear speckle splicing regulatory protein 1 isoform X2 [Onychomys torridus]